MWAGTTVLYRYIFTLSDLVLIILYVKVKMDPKKKEGRRKICGVSRVYLHVNTIGYILLSKSIQVLYYIYIIIAPLD